MTDDQGNGPDQWHLADIPVLADELPSCEIAAAMASSLICQAVAKFTCSLVVGTLPEIPRHRRRVRRVESGGIQEMVL